MFRNKLPLSENTASFRRQENSYIYPAYSEKCSIYRGALLSTETANLQAPAPTKVGSAWEKSETQALYLASRFDRGILLNHENVDLQDQTGRTALSWAALSLDEDVIKILLNKGADPNLLDKGGSSPLYYVMCNLSAEHTLILRIVKILLAAGANPSIENRFGMNPLMVCFLDSVQKIPYTLVATLLDAGANPNVKNSSGKTPLMIVCERNLFSFAKILIDAGADVNARDLEGNTALMIAAQESQICNFAFLIKKKLSIDVNACNDKGYNALMYLCEKGLDRNLDLFFKESIQPVLDIQSKEGNTALMLAAKRGKKEVVSKLIAAGASLDFQDAQGYTALMYACFANSLDIVKDLCLAGAKINLSTPLNETGLSIALAQGNVSIVEYLFTREDLQCKFANLDLLLLAASGNFELLELILRKEDLQLNIDAVDEHSGKTLLMVAIEHQSHLKLIQLILSKGANPNIQDRLGLNALGIAMLTRRFEIFEYLLKNCPQLDVDAIQLGKGSALHLAIEQQQCVDILMESLPYSDELGSLVGQTPWVDFIDALLIAKASPYQNNVEGYNAFHLACLFADLVVLNRILYYYPNFDIRVEAQDGTTSFLLLSACERLDIWRYLESRAS